MKMLTKKGLGRSGRVDYLHDGALTLQIVRFWSVARRVLQLLDGHRFLGAVAVSDHSHAHLAVKSLHQQRQISSINRHYKLIMVMTRAIFFFFYFLLTKSPFFVKIVRF